MYNIDKIKPHKQQIEVDNLRMRTEVLIDGPTRVFRLVSMDTHGALLLDSANEPLPLISTNLENVKDLEHSDEKVVEKSLVCTCILYDTERKVMLSLPGIGVSLVNSEPKEVAYLALDAISGLYTNNPSNSTFDLTIMRAQLDNQLRC